MTLPEKIKYKVGSKYSLNKEITICHGRGTGGFPDPRKEVFLKGTTLTLFRIRKVSTKNEYILSFKDPENRLFFDTYTNIIQCVEER